MMFGWHWCCEAFAVLHSKLLQAIFEVFLLRYEDVVALLADLKTEEELQLTHHGHLILLLYHVPKLITVFLVGCNSPKIGLSNFVLLFLPGTHFQNLSPEFAG